MAAGIDLSFPFTGRWLVQNSPASRIPSHGTTLFATSYAIDFVPVTDSGRTAPFTMRSLLRPEPAARFPGFGRPVLSPVEGTVVAVHDGYADHPAYRGLPSIRYAATQRSRASDGWPTLAGNHVLIEAADAVIALCHLEHDSIAVSLGQHVVAGDVLARCGNSGNSTEPHLHVQALDDRNIGRARAVPLTFRGSLPRNGEIVTA
ncbi:MAG: M23 family metallopeptidase [Protaetiibacter sp.]